MAEALGCAEATHILMNSEATRKEALDAAIAADLARVAEDWAAIEVKSGWL